MSAHRCLPCQKCQSAPQDLCLPDLPGMPQGVIPVPAQKCPSAVHPRRCHERQVVCVHAIGGSQPVQYGQGQWYSEAPGASEGGAVGGVRL
eukprot:1160791-Pelagomonas_calceolata.AAC.1